MTRLAFGAKCGKPGKAALAIVASALALAPCATRSSPSRCANAAIPTADEERLKNWRRLIVDWRSDGALSIN
jgi:hypothetical protein